jgi:hypothetical protein
VVVVVVVVAVVVGVAARGWSCGIAASCHSD